MNAVALSDTNISGNPNAANDFRRSSIVADDVAVLVTWASILRECASTINRNNFPPVALRSQCGLGSMASLAMTKDEEE